MDIEPIKQEPLPCNSCGKQGQLKPFGRNFIVTCSRFGEACCQTKPQATGDAAVACWRGMHK